MPRSNWCRSLLLAGLGSLVLAAGAAGAGPPPPRAVNGHPVATVATRVSTPTSFAFDAVTGTVFVGAFGNEKTGKGGGVVAIVPGRAPALVPGIPSGVAGLVYQGGTLYTSAVTGFTGKILAFSGWNGTAFASSKTIFKAAQTVGSVNGLAWGPDGRLYGGAGLAVDVDKKGKAKKSPFPHPYTVFSILPDGTDFKVVSRGLRQPWQMTFVGTSPNPFVSVLSQDAGKIPRDAIVVAQPGANYGFPKCFAGVGLSCKPKYAKPLIKLPRHASPMGIQAVGNTLYVALFGGIGKSGPEVVTIPAQAGAKPTPFLTGFAAPVVAVGISGGALYAGDLTGSVYKVAL
jgi:glucose/arabinose dehydrogenase